MQDRDARLNGIICRSGYGDGMRGATVFGFIEPASYMLVQERLHLRRPGLDAGAGGLAVLQGDDELGFITSEGQATPAAALLPGSAVRFIQRHFHDLVHAKKQQHQ